MNKREIDEATFVRAFGAQPRGGLDLEKWKKLRVTVAIYLAELPEPEPGRDRIAVVVRANGSGVGWALREGYDMDKSRWEALERDAHPTAKLARAIVRCNLPRPAQPTEVDGTVEEIGG